ncbi:stomatin-like protein 2 [Rickettsia felis str. Pedreira]|uniref:Stomatin-like protein 2 n=2 Tax=Rickettsia felis TaxID=42862 RepID=A0A0F3MR54_RICFI|nr:stomatin-like protein [Rickettsia felis]AAY61384.1 Membrane protease subunits [Rickettsia felis URRWXCal2]KHO02855.1 stomatin 2 [Rickettsia felis str. LSU]KHO03821.1 stomatin 2 [Rickettsia felis]KJV57937.1 stomatin-like protein 2 [Rickettsia felis str. Pedreira]MDE8611060.1 paraslipin [Rickettsia felis]
MEYALLIFSIIAILVIIQMVKVVPQQQAWVVEKLGKFDKVLQPGLNLLIPVIQKVAYKHTLKEEAIDVTAQTAISNDNVTLSIDGVLYVKIIDPIAASYGVNNPYYAITQLAQTTMRSEIGKLPLDKTFEERETLNVAIVAAINQAAINWGIQCMRYEIKDIQPPQTILKAMELQVAAERQKRAQILESEGNRQAKINHAEGEKAQIVLNSEASYTDQINRAKGEAEAIGLVATATANSIEIVAAAVQKTGGSDAVALKIAEQYISAFGNLAKDTNTVILPTNLSEPSSFVTGALTIFNQLKASSEKKIDK